MFLRRYFSSFNMKYEEAVRTLNCLQTGNRPKIRDGACLVAMQQLLDRVSITQEDLKKLNVIHVSGTKGKGSTCAFIESILRHHGYKTGFFSSPHLIEVRERIRINGKPLTKTDFADFFEDLSKKLRETRNKYEDPYESYFYFLTLMAFHVFLVQRVDVAIMEVGIGGSFDCTNVIQYPIVCGVSSLGYDHTALLGDAIESIAWHKAGIFKPGAPAFTAPQSYSAMQVLGQSALEAQIMLQSCPDLSSYRVKDGKSIKLGLAGEHQKINASLALQIAETWMRRTNEKRKTDDRYVYMSEMEAFPYPAPAFPLTETHLKALEECTWRGRAQVLKFKNLTFYLDGAHTVQSMQCCARWFQQEAAEEEKKIGAGCIRILAFNVTKNRDAAAFFTALQDCNISQPLFTPNIATLTPTDCADQTNLKSTLQDQILCAVHNQDAWIQMKKDQKRELLNQQMRSSTGGHSSHEFQNSEMSPDTEAPVFPTIADAVAWLSEGRDEDLYNETIGLASADKTLIPKMCESKHIQVLVTGSVHLVGGYLRILDPHMND